MTEQTGQPAPTTTTSLYVFEAAVREAAVKSEDVPDDDAKDIVCARVKTRAQDILEKMTGQLGLELPTTAAASNLIEQCEHMPARAA